MADSARAYADAGIGYHPYVEPAPGAGKGTQAERLVAAGCESLVIHFLHSTANPAHELRALLLSHQMLAEIDHDGVLARHLAPTLRVQLRQRLLDKMRLEADRNESLVRVRLFGAGLLALARRAESK